MHIFHHKLLPLKISYFKVTRRTFATIHISHRQKLCSNNDIELRFKIVELYLLYKLQVEFCLVLHFKKLNCLKKLSSSSTSSLWMVNCFLTFFKHNKMSLHTERYIMGIQWLLKWQCGPAPYVSYHRDSFKLCLFISNSPLKFVKLPFNEKNCHLLPRV